ncbi:Transcription factor jumonji aspartyl beta-hydroxylase protein [Lasiodiplodia theobromae]|uniref:Transcription factor jumonji aspartyl beta-hydroxylase protein n=1 Tax=Lasiodiplodia theobromae TaxID=45133 RepID=UPI0015C3A1BA|nr:Transcription factor jumonji aspartyl beta-hydroxylase protein [Lasiodiplodia theobromae]KAF4543007.1 Transcription factor jumonji aspartyl beta-hydroxylase protein [Lasiodiplodia theobromae]
MLSKAVDREQQLRKSLTTANSDSAASNATESSSGFYHGPVKFGLSQMKEAFVPTIYKVLESFPDCKHLGYCKVRLDRDVLRGVDYMAMRSYTVSELKGHQSAAVILKPWNGHKKMVCSVFIATRKDGHLVSDFTFEDMQVAEDTADLNGRDLFCSTVEDASESTQKPYLVIPTECTPEWRTSAGLPPEPYVHCGDQLTCTAGRIVGIHTAYEYISSAAQSATGIHVEDAFLGSANVVLAGAPKFVRHLNALLSPKLLDEWMIPYQIVSCSAGEMIITLPGAYHQVVNAGANYAQAINFAMPDWSGPPDGYRFCGKGCAQTDPPTAEHFEIRAGKGTTGHEDEGGEEGKEDEEDEDGEEREEQEEDDSNECEKTRASGTDSINVLSNALVSLNMPTMEANMSGSDPFKTLHSYMAIELTNPRKRNASLISANNEIEDDDGIRDEGNDSSSQASTEIAADPLSQVLQPEINYWRDCVFRAAQGGGFNADAILQALQNAPTTQPAATTFNGLRRSSSRGPASYNRRRQQRRYAYATATPLHH